METNHALTAFSALAHPMRLDALRLLITAEPDGMVAGDIATRLNVLPNTLSANLAALSQADLVRVRREGRQMRYFANLGTVQALVGFLLNDCCAGHPDLCAPCPKVPMAQKPLNVLFLCTANSARSLIAEAILNADPSGRFRAYSAGSQPAGAPNPRTLALLDRLGYDTGAVRSKSWDEFAGPDAPQMDFVFTVCDNAASETCPVWPGQPVSAHWGVPDPAAVTGSDAEQAAAFNAAHQALATRLSLFTALPVETLERKSLLARVTEIGQS